MDSIMSLRQTIQGRRSSNWKRVCQCQPWHLVPSVVPPRGARFYIDQAIMSHKTRISVASGNRIPVIQLVLVLPAANRLPVAKVCVGGIKQLPGLDFATVEDSVAWELDLTVCRNGCRRRPQNFLPLLWEPTDNLAPTTPTSSTFGDLVLMYKCKTCGWSTVVCSRR
jgi:hypothetical protein